MTTRSLVLLSDFGAQDPYVGIVKSVMMGIAPRAPQIDLTHHVPPQDVAAGGFVLAAALPYFPNDTVVWAVVDPGVGSARRAIALEATHTDRRLTFIAPDNGLLTECLAQLDDAVATHLNDPTFHLPNPGNTFHGRDVFGPAAAHVAAGISPRALGTPIDVTDLEQLDVPRATRHPDGIHGCVRWIDRFGDAITNIPAELVGAGAGPVYVGGERIDHLSATFGSVAEGQLVAYVGSWGTLEIAVRGGDAARRLGLRTGAEVVVTLGAALTGVS